MGQKKKGNFEMKSYPKKYSDAYGTENTVITNDGEDLRVTIRGIEFFGGDFDSLEIVYDRTPEELKSKNLVLNHNDLCSCKIESQITVFIEDKKKRSKGILLMELELGEPASNGGITSEDVKLTLEYKKEKFSSRGKSGWFEDELLEIQEKLPEEVFMKACIMIVFTLIIVLMDMAYLVL
jgi:hypothetical protein